MIYILPKRFEIIDSFFLLVAIKTKSYSTSLPQIWIGGKQSSLSKEPNGNWIWATSGRTWNLMEYTSSYRKRMNGDKRQNHMALYYDSSTKGFNDFENTDVMFPLCECVWNWLRRKLYYKKSSMNSLSSPFYCGKYQHCVFCKEKNWTPIVLNLNYMHT